ncbi:beta-D-glucoside glucohydrolase [Candidatus Francisella endociliophora]|uniref:Periplasmic beta-glucosidase n=1 Tax=Candidatus Francisella endociliophora TaxID=653937 RepID=A0A097EMA6_9GAMM|nr:beta-glucosidase BglX [Francisella sp. FSC1006]AIT08702.1 beta-D-glucoside glucohydrolase [Francisella sp. FSC1006]
MKKILALAICASLGTSCSFLGKTNNTQVTNSYTVNEEKYEDQADKLISQMTLEEKLGQLNLVDAGQATTGISQQSKFYDLIKAGKAGGVFNLKDPKDIAKAQKMAVEDTRLHIPLLVGMDIIHGYKTAFPIPLGLSTSWDLGMIEKTARVASIEASSEGINWAFSPMVDISRDPRWGRIAESSGEDTYLGSQIAKAMVKGYQLDDLSKDATLLASVKHFALYGAAEAGRDYNTVDMSKVRMYNEYLPPYKAAIDAGVGTIMASFNEINGVPATANKWLLTDLLRDQWGFQGVVVSDYTGIPEMINHGIGKNLQAVSAAALNAGTDMDMVGNGYLTTLKKSLDEGKVSIDEINQAVKRILIAKFELGLFDNPYKYGNPEIAKQQVFSKEHREFARKVGAESMVLLKNQEHLLPLKKSQTIALVGPLADAANNMAGTWSVTADQDKSISLLKGLKEVVGQKGKILYAKGSNLSYSKAFEKNATMFNKSLGRNDKSSKELLDEALKVANKSDVIIAALGESAEMSGESTSRTDLRIPKAQRDLLKALVKTGKPIVLVLFNGRPLVLNEEKKEVPAILDVWFPGSEAGLSIADVLFGDVNPSGKLTASFPRNVGQIPIYYSHKNTGRPLEKNDCKFEKFHSNYMDTCNTPLYPFGYGLSYTTFNISKPTQNHKVIKEGDKLIIKVNITNTGDYDGADVLQLYVHQKVRSITPPVKELKKFKKVFLKKGQTKTVTFKLDINDLKFYNNDLNYVYEPGEFEFFVNDSSDGKFTNKFTVK